jgi:hypothetical protein
VQAHGSVSSGRANANGRFRGNAIGIGKASSRPNAEVARRGLVARKQSVTQSQGSPCSTLAGSGYGIPRLRRIARHLANDGAVSAQKVADAMKKYGINADKINPPYARRRCRSVGSACADRTSVPGLRAERVQAPEGLTPAPLTDRTSRVRQFILRDN